MSSILLRQRWHKQPSYPQAIDWSNPLTRELRAAMNAATLIDHVTNQVAGWSGARKVTSGKFGVSTLGNNDNLAFVPIPTTLGTSITMMLVANDITRVASNFLIGLGATSGNSLAAFQFETPTNNRFVLRMQNGGSLSVREYSANATTSPGARVLAAAWNSNTGASINVYIDGESDNGGSSGATPGAATIFNRFAIGGVLRSTSDYAQVGNDIALGLLWNRRLPDEEIRELSRNPWQIFQPLRRRLYFGGQTLALEQEGFRFRDDDGGEAAATWLAAQDANISLPREQNFRLRFLVNATGDTPSSQYQLEARKTGTSEWFKVS